MYLRVCGTLATCLLELSSFPLPATAQTAAWTWVGGNSTAADSVNGQSGIYGQVGVAAAGNIPPGRWDSTAWTDAHGNLWFLGGAGYYAAANQTGVLLNDLWEFDPSTSEWTWMGGSNVSGTQAAGVYGALGTPAVGNFPGCRSGAVGWADSAGDLWLFGGDGCDANGNVGSLNDLWKYSPSTNEWTWMAGSNTIGSGNGRPGVYGTLGVAAPGNTPGGRSGASGWIDADGNFWLSGGNGVDSAGDVGILNDLWKYVPGTNQWTWMGGGNTVAAGGGSPGVYGTLGMPSGGNIPGSRFGISHWSDANGQTWIFGGSGYDAKDQLTTLNDLWEFSPANVTWTWVGGSTTSTGCITYQQGLVVCGGQPGVYGTPGTPAASNIPGGRASAAFWIDETGDFWLFGGQGYDSSGNQGNLNDLWVFNPNTSDWTWMGGNTTAVGCSILSEGNTFCNGQPGIYGTIGTPGPGNNPGARFGAASWVDSQGDLWLFGGYGVDETGTAGVLDDLWEYQQAALVMPPAAMPTFSPPAGTYSSNQAVTIADATPGATIYFTTDGSAPTTASTVYTSPVAISSSGATTTETIEAIAVASGYSASTMASATYTINLPPDFSIALSPNSLTIPAGQSGTLTVTATPSNGFAASVSFACSGLPSRTSCNFSPASVSPQLSPASTTLTVTNSTSSANLNRNSEPLLTAAALAAFAICFCRKRRKLLAELTAIMVLVIFLAAANGCGGSSSKSQSTTEMVTVTATSGSLQHSATFTLTIR